MKIAMLRLANAIKIGTSQVDFLSNDRFDITLEGVTVRCVDRDRMLSPDETVRRSAVTYTTLFNTVYWSPESEQEPATKRK